MALLEVEDLRVGFKTDDGMVRAVDGGDLRPFEELLTVLAKPYEEQPAFAAYAEPPEPTERVYQTFCGT